METCYQLYKLMLTMLYLWKHLSIQGLLFRFQLFCDLSVNDALLNRVDCQVNHNKTRKVIEEGLFFSLLSIFLVYWKSKKLLK